MIDYERFSRLRLTNFLPAKRVALLHDWEFEDHLWIGEAYGFSEWLRLSDEPDLLKSLAIDFDSFPARAARRVMAQIDLPVRKGMTISELRVLLGSIRRTERFAADRRTYEFMTAGSQPFQISCTVLESGGLIYLGVMIPLRAKRRRRD